MKSDKKLTAASLWVPVVILLIGLTVGFLLLSTVYTGPVIWKVVVFVVYLVVVILMIRSVRKLSEALKEQQEKK